MPSIYSTLDLANGNFFCICATRQVQYNQSPNISTNACVCTLYSVCRLYTKERHISWNRQRIRSICLRANNTSHKIEPELKWNYTINNRADAQKHEKLRKKILHTTRPQNCSFSLTEATINPKLNRNNAAKAKAQVYHSNPRRSIFRYTRNTR